MTMIQFLGEWILRSSILILSGALLLWLPRVKNPSVRLTAWTALLSGSLAIPLLALALPKVPLPVVGSQPRLHSAAAPALTREPAVILPSDAISMSAALQSAGSTPFEWTRFAAILYVLIAGVLLLRLFGGLVLSLRILCRSRLTTITTAGVEVRESERVASPVTIGVLRPAILLPLDWRGWDSAKFAAVLAHERSHIRRRDPAVQFVSSIHRALLWASPLSWFLDRSIVRTAEQISDDDAVAATADRVSYAEILLEFVQRCAGQTNVLGVPMARYDRPEKRIRRILNSTVIPRAVTRGGIAAILSLGAPLAYLAAAAHPQSAPALPAFEVASVKPVEPNVSHMVGVKVYPGGRVTISTFSLKTLIATAFALSSWQISGGDDWIRKDQFNIEAEPPEAMRSSITNLRYTLFGIDDPRLRQMLQALLMDRFQLKFHRETKTGDVYLLEKSGKPLQLRPTELPSANTSPDHGAFGSIGYVSGKWSLFATSMPQLAKFASDFILRVPVIDRTDLPGTFDYTKLQPDLEPNYTGDQSASFQSYLSELGLKLERSKAPVESFVIDHAVKPTAN